ncbi:hypothetical protein FN846DRAFT_594064 [Sphaerosporella brunnea]|uniref:Uncharacterized protein n=1 Tax=Sphaerosporella brunnea TaxID=1250544 RepID=A0A5J5F1M7_9PEZI|nr:hypothetical protein FN846DRAFT_594064 [Sphaerosporella brunnea]
MDRSPIKPSYSPPPSPSIPQEWSYLKNAAFTTTNPTPRHFPGRSSSASSPPPLPRQYREYQEYRNAGAPSNSPSPCQSITSASSDSNQPRHASMLEIEEVTDFADDVDSGIDVLHGEFEDAPEEGAEDYYSDEDSNYDNNSDAENDKRFVLIGLQRMWQYYQRHGGCERKNQDQWPSTPMLRKRTLAESLDGGCEGGDYDYDSGNNTDSSSGGQIRRRKLAATSRRPEVETESMRSTPDLIMDMEL